MLRTGLSELTAFIAVAEHRSFRAAAKKLGVSAPALSHAIRNLESGLNVRLFNRTTRSVALTEAGEHLLRRAGPALADLEDGINEVMSAGTRPSGSIRISSAEAVARPLILHVLPDFLAAYPEIHVEVVVDTRLIDIVADGFDAGIRVLDDVPRDMIAVEFGPAFRFAAVASPEYLSGHRPPKTPQDLRQHKCIRYRFLSGTLYHWEFERRSSGLSVDVDGPMTLGNPNLMVDAALAGIGVAWVPEYLVVEHLATGRLVHLLPDWSPSMPGLCLYYPANRHPPEALRLFSQAVREWANKSTKYKGNAKSVAVPRTAV